MVDYIKVFKGEDSNAVHYNLSGNSRNGRRETRRSKDIAITCLCICGDRHKKEHCYNEQRNYNFINYIFHRYNKVLYF